MKITRRQFLAGSAGTIAGAVLFSRLADAVPGKIRVGACDWSLGAVKPEGIDVAKAAGLDGLEISAGNPADVLKIADAAWRKQYKDKMAATGIVAPSTAMGLLNSAPLATDPRGPAWLDQVIDATKDLDAKVILLAFFGKGDLRDKDGNLKPNDVDVVVQRLKDAAPKAKEKGVILGIENTLSAKQNVDILERVQSDSVLVYYDIRNSTDNGYDVPAEIRFLGDRICQIHFKDGDHYLGQGEVKMEPVAEAMAAINYVAWVVLETSTPSKDRVADFKKNAEYTRQLLKIG
ncbi:MAG: sugar phosphate isomerase/epimerase [Candidatus Hydrogenedentes bacterium]|nr:sugar phosphate isomerase/epimerase [Candidatus Hydrogenedentota bacterium]